MMNNENVIVAILFLAAGFASCRGPEKTSELTERFDGKYGQVEVGGRYVGAEFHHSRPLPSRISFFYPVANSLDISTGYWERDLSLPLIIEIDKNGHTDTLGLQPAVYEYTPYSVAFYDTLKNYHAEIKYEFSDDLPVMALSINLRPLSHSNETVQVSVSLDPTLRTSHSFTRKYPANIMVNADSTLTGAFYDDIETDSVVVILLDASEKRDQKSRLENPAIFVNVPQKLHLVSAKKLSSDAPLNFVYLIGSCRQNEVLTVIEKARTGWKNGIREMDQRIKDCAYHQAIFKIQDPAIQKTLHWAKAAIAGLLHYIDGRFVPMPCPAEYNYFFTHDLLLTGLGVMAYNSEFVKNGYEFLLSKTEADSVLPHAYFWRDGQFVTEKCNSDNWNLLWSIISAGAYLKHSGDEATVRKLYPILKKSLNSMLQNMSDDFLMYATRPDWWDIGDRYGARTYITALTIRALEDFVFISSAIGRSQDAVSFVSLPAKMKASLKANLWNEEQAFLLNALDKSSLDFHYYAGSLMACIYNAVDDSIKQRILQTARDQLLDTQLGIRNAWPPDFHELIDVYRFNGMEVGKPYYYFNGGIWSQNNAWYALALIQANQMNQAEQFIKNYMTLDGIRKSPNGQPSFYEYRMTDPDDANYGAIDKPNFLWAAGWYVHVLYRLAGLRDNSWNIIFSPHVPDDFTDFSYDVLLSGALCRVSCTGSGHYFKNILIDGQEGYSAVVLKPAKKFALQRGKPDYPYLATAVGRIQNVTFNKKESRLVIDLSAIEEQDTQLKVVSPLKLIEMRVNGSAPPKKIAETLDDGIYTLVVNDRCKVTQNQYIFQF